MQIKLTRNHDSKPSTASEKASPIDPDKNGGQFISLRVKGLGWRVDVEQETIFLTKEVPRYCPRQLSELCCIISQRKVKLRKLQKCSFSLVSQQAANLRTGSGRGARQVQSCWPRRWRSVQSHFNFNLEDFVHTYTGGLSLSFPIGGFAKGKPWKET